MLDASLAASSGPILGAADVRLTPQPETPTGAPARLEVSEPPEVIEEEPEAPAGREREAELPAAEVAAPAFEAESPPVERRDADADPGLAEILAPLAQEIRQPVLAMDLIMGRDRFARRFLRDYRARQDQI